MPAQPTRSQRTLQTTSSLQGAPAKASETQNCCATSEAQSTVGCRVLTLQTTCLCTQAASKLFIIAPVPHCQAESGLNRQADSRRQEEPGIQLLAVRPRKMKLQLWSSGMLYMSEKAQSLETPKERQVPLEDCQKSAGFALRNCSPSVRSLQRSTADRTSVSSLGLEAHGFFRCVGMAGPGNMRNKAISPFYTTGGQENYRDCDVQMTFCAHLRHPRTRRSMRIAQCKAANTGVCALMFILLKPWGP